MENMTETKVIINTGLDTPNGLGVDWIANNIYWTDNDFKVLFLYLKENKTSFIK